MTEAMSTDCFPTTEYKPHIKINISIVNQYCHWNKMATDEDKTRTTRTTPREKKPRQRQKKEKKKESGEALKTSAYPSSAYPPNA